MPGLIGIGEFIEETRDDYNSPTTSTETATYYSGQQLGTDESPCVNVTISSQADCLQVAI
ncbi:unnamed protein product [Plutella xylostella]|uniref:(diamondback moth) hypothetical protein n=1 Tax=Plutella xylostella TaxID=51655 RepID=A0A8S4EQE1_PLUXY|nr:unnamed protein product [Plutella xylostella]